MGSVFKSVVTFGSSCYVVFICRVAFTSEDSYRIAYVKDTLVAYARILAPGNHFKNHGIGRVAVKESHRKRGFAKALVKGAIDFIEERPENKTIELY